MAMKRSRPDEDSENEDIDGEEGNVGNVKPFPLPVSSRRKCPYLDTVNRQLLDFDMEKLCSVTLTNMNVYACLVCGKFFHGRGQGTPAYTHSVQHGHFVFLNLHTCKAYCLPDNYEIVDSSLDDVKRCLQPSFALEEIQHLSRSSVLARDVHGVAYLPGFVGLNNLTGTDYINVTLHALSHVTPLRNFFLDPTKYATSRCPVVHKFGETVRKLWSRHNFKSVVSPQEFIQVVSRESQKRFNIGCQTEAIDFMIWLLNKLHVGLGGSRKGQKSIIHQCFQGVLEVASMTRHKVLITSSLDTSTTEAADDDTTGEGTHTIQQDEDGGVRMEERWSTENQTTPFMFLSLDIPPTPLFKDSQGGLIIPQIPLFEVLAKFDGSTWTDGLHKSTGSLVRKQYKLKSLPRYLILHLNRFTKNNFYVEKNPTIVTFPVKNLEMRDYLQTPDTSATTAGGNKSTDCGGEVDTLLTKTTDDIDTMSVKELKEVVRRFGNKLEVKAAASAVEKKQLQDVARTCMIRRCSDNLEDSELMDECDATTLLSSKYDLMANICHDSAVSQGMTIVTDSKKPKSKAQLQQTSGHAAGKSAVNGGLNVLEGGSYRVHIQNKATSQWFELQDLHVMETMPQMIGLSESYMLIYEKKSATTNGAQSRNITT